VKLIYDRAEDMAATTKRHPSRTRHKTAITDEGRLLAMEIDFTIDGGAYCTLTPVVLSRGTLHAGGPYVCPNVRIVGRAVATMARHAAPHGLVIVEPWFLPEAWSAGHVHAIFVDEDDLKVARMTVSEPLAEQVTAALLPFADVPLALFGHSMGASLAYEVALRLENTQGLRPQGLYVSARPAPHRVVPRTTHLKTDEDLLAEVRALGGIADPEVLDHPELRELILPALRADYRVVGTYRPRPPVPVGCPVAAYAGTQDTTASLDAVRAWADVAPAGFHLEVLPGDHFYLVGRREQVIRDLAGRLA
jgi:pyochelin biosynthetic protein PchC